MESQQSWRPHTNAFCGFSTPHNHLSKPEDLMLQNATPLRKSAPWPPNSSDEHVTCIVPATRKTSCEILCICPTPAIVLGNATKPSRFAHFLTRCIIPEACHAKRHMNVQKWSESVSFLTLLTSKCASCHNGMHFFDISTSKLAPTLRCFVHFAQFVLPKMISYNITLEKSRGNWNGKRGEREREREREIYIYYFYLFIHILSL